jgi:hypothetical protein
MVDQALGEIEIFLLGGSLRRVVGIENFQYASYK